MQAQRPLAALGAATGDRVDDHDLAVAHEIVLPRA